ncbi:hypothetical protein [Aquimarina sp. AU474]|uniref:hypothetical protein n=1 Tax=Aquimarina sp. AU474 TaxID=2108529 RepID=UPI000D687DA1|nr:hypothetical protein [Aquimarina sp. AU474]
MNLNKQILLLFTFVITTFQSCKIADLRTSAINNSTPDREQKAIDLLNKTIKNQNLDILVNSKTYSYKIKDNWKGVLALMNPFPKDNELMEMRFRPKSFDSQFYYVNAKNRIIYGVQSFNYYKIDRTGNLKFKDKKSISFSLPAIQYLFELPIRIKDAPILKYAGIKKIEGVTYDLVYATWKSLEPNKEFDQYVLYISQKTGLLSFASYTVRDSYLPSPKNIYGSIRYEDMQENADGIKYPAIIYIQINGLKSKNKWTRKMTLKDLKLNDFEVSLLYPNKKLNFLGDSKN